nr:unnamed protein product [Callosobruchus chinensis]
MTYLIASLQDGTQGFLKEAVAYYQFVTFMKQRKAIAYH